MPHRSGGERQRFVAVGSTQRFKPAWLMEHGGMRMAGDELVPTAIGQRIKGTNVHGLCTNVAPCAVFAQLPSTADWGSRLGTGSPNFRLSMRNSVLSICRFTE